jgi:hypothetical protein
VIVAAAQDTGGESAAGKFYERAKVSFPALIDTQHVVSSLYHLVNVPMGVWVDEQGRIVRPAEVAYSKKVQFLSIKVDGDRYVAALRDWVENGDKSRYVLRPSALTEKLGARKSTEDLADAHFKLGAYFHQQGKKDLAKKHWQEAQRLHPDSWNYHRQEWSFTPGEAMTKWLAKFRSLGDKPYYPPSEIP